MKIEAKNRLVMSKASIAARRATDRPEHYSWVWVIPLKSGKFRVAAIEVPKHFVDDDDCFFEDDMITPYVKIVEEIGDIDSAVREAGVDPELLDAPWHSDFPL
ncbi:hypothetical protein Asp14428_78160 [Actinoplanes sp. NBRC 14428]|nr:hypothetical protein Asp14428_78160 [Actinoplanes sp. NBRC 14428]